MKNCLITGASRGVGREIALALAKDGCNLVLHGRDVDALTESCRLAEKVGGKTTPVIADLSTTQGVDSVINCVNEGPLHLLVHNAGVAFVKPFEQLTFEQWQETMAVNLTAPFMLTKKLFPIMAAGASIVNILSVAAKIGFPNWSSYCASKFALEGLMQSMREELRPRGVRVINVYPSATSTELWNDIPGDWPEEKMLSPEEIAQAVYYAINRPASVLIENITLGHISGTL